MTDSTAGPSRNDPWQVEIKPKSEFDERYERDLLIQNERNQIAREHLETIQDDGEWRESEHRAQVHAERLRTALLTAATVHQGRGIIADALRGAEDVLDWIGRHGQPDEPSPPEEVERPLGLWGAELIALERDRQQAKYSAVHDDIRNNGHELTAAARAYLDLMEGEGRPLENGQPEGWPWPDRSRSYDEPWRYLVDAGALIAAEIDRRLRARQAGRWGSE